MTINKRVKAFVELGNFLKQFIDSEKKADQAKLNNLFFEDFENLIKTVHIYNAWFSEDNVREALKNITEMIEESALVDWIANYSSQINNRKVSKNVAVIMAGNIPMVGFNDMLCVLISGNKLIAKLSSEDKLLLPFLSKILIAIEPEFLNFIEFTDKPFKNIDAVIATGSNNSALYFNYYFEKYPHIIRKNRNSVAVLTGNESPNQLERLGKDIFQYYGLGCRSVSKLFVPTGYDFHKFYENVFKYNQVVNNNKYVNNYEYNRTIYLMNSDKSLLDNNFLLLKEDKSYASPIGVLFYEHYENLKELQLRLTEEKDQIQCVVSECEEIKDALKFGDSQCPTLNDYADGIDTIQFLLSL